MLKTETIERERKFLFWKLPHKKVILIDKVVNSNGKVILKRKSVFLVSMDSSEDKIFRRIKIVDREIQVFRHSRDYQNQFIELYDFCGKYKGRRIWKDGDFYKTK
ncbi:hypothetical protein [Aquimarina algiphila]|uniref:Uncharacterized protein n=1 Tax=Aquimarina algiphila TaxID=2047982 RepID=A0A554VES4_9FLAO|nr:hypothetical protein [Aquimarina algiphila]TSE05592.1 hypothetical protein FOF46_22355 [Aquimarina algiphila]